MRILVCLLTVTLIFTGGPKLVSAATSETTTSTTVPIVEDTSPAAAPDIASSPEVGSADFAAIGSCSIDFWLDAGGDWSSVRFIATFDRHHGRFAGPPESIDCTWSDLFSSRTAQSRLGVLQIQVQNADDFALVHGPARVASCVYEYDAAPTSDTFTTQVQLANAAASLEDQPGLPSISLSTDCHGY